MNNNRTMRADDVVRRFIGGYIGRDEYVAELLALVKWARYEARNAMTDEYSEYWENQYDRAKFALDIAGGPRPYRDSNKLVKTN